MLADSWVSTSFHSSKEYLGWIAFSLIIANQINNEAVIFFSLPGKYLQHLKDAVFNVTRTFLRRVLL